jgi:16S rRNA (guanine(966)-N(2))-methyltransferase RsmD
VRIISGTARGSQLSSFCGQEIRPTSDRVRGAIFSILTSRIGSFNNLRVLDIFAGTGALGLEALSRGAAEVVFIDSGAQAQKLIATNSQRCRLEHNTRRINSSAQKALPSLQGQCFDLIFMDPPYAQELIPEILQLIEQYSLLAQDGIIYAEEGKKVVLPQQSGCFHQVEQRTYAATTIYLYQHNTSASSEH